MTTEKAGATISGSRNNWRDTTATSGKASGAHEQLIEGRGELPCPGLWQQVGEACMGQRPMAQQQLPPRAAGSSGGAGTSGRIRLAMSMRLVRIAFHRQMAVPEAR